MAFAEIVIISSAFFDEQPIERPQWEEVASWISRLHQDDLHSVVICGAGDFTRLSIVLGHNGMVTVNWHDDSDASGNGSFILANEDADPSKVIVSVPKWDQGAESPAREYVDRSLALPAAKEFFETGARAEGLPWSSNFGGADYG